MQLHYHEVMEPNVEAESTLTDRYQTTVPEPVRKALRLSKRSKIQYLIRSNGEVVLRRADEPDAEDPLLSQFLGFLANDIAKHPERIQSVDVGLVEHLRALTAEVDVDLDAPLSEDDE
jgi:antitoxin PrlF